MTREHMVTIELTPEEFLLQSKAILLATIVLKDPTILSISRYRKDGMDTALSIIQSGDSWDVFLHKMHNICVKCNSVEGC